MKKIAASVIAVMVVAGALPLLAEESAPSKEQRREKSMFQIISDTITKRGEVRERNKLRPVKEVAVFQSLSNGIKEGSAKAKNLSARETK